MGLGKNLIDYKAVAQYTLDGKLVKRYGNHLSLADYFVEQGIISKKNRGILCSSVLRCCEGEIESYRDHIFIYYENQFGSIDDPKSLEYKKNKTKIIYRYNIDRELIGIYTKFSEVADEMGITNKVRRGYMATAMGKCCEGEYLYFDNYIYVYQGSLDLPDDNPKSLNYKFNNIKVVEQYTHKKELVDVFISAKEASKSLGSSSTQSIIKSCEGQTRGVLGNFFVYRECRDLSVNDPRSLAHKAQDNVQKWGMNAELEDTYYNCSDASKEHKISNSNISQCIAGKHHSIAGSIWLLEKDAHLVHARIEKCKKGRESIGKKSAAQRAKAVVKLDPVTKIKITSYDSCKGAQRVEGVQASSIISCCKGRSNTAGGFAWMYEEDYLKLNSNQ